MTRISGIDVSAFQRNIDWPTVRQTQRFAVLRATRGNLTAIDSRFHQYASGAASAGIPFSAYHFAWPNSSAVTQANKFADTVSGYPTSLPLVLDLETKPNGPSHARDSLTKRQRTDWAITFIETLEDRTGRPPMLYFSGLYPAGFLVRDERLTRLPCWIAWYNRVNPPPPDGWTKWHIHQWSDQLRVNGSQGNSAGATDLNWSTEANLAELVALGTDTPPSNNTVNEPLISDSGIELAVGYRAVTYRNMRRNLNQIEDAATEVSEAAAKLRLRMANNHRFTSEESE